jgi:CxxC-x17-CxxC domain-containing protein
MGNFGRDRRGGGGGRSFGGPRRDFGGDRGGRGGFGGGFGGDSGGRREMFSATCSDCGKECQVPFKPTNGKPVYCSDCFEKINGGRDTSRRPERSDNRPQGGGYDQSKIQLEAISVKLDKILALLEPKTIETVMPDIVVEETKPEKVKKVVKKVASKKKE